VLGRYATAHEPRPHGWFERHLGRLLCVVTGGMLVSQRHQS
jgi:hypothetical protein